MGGEAVDSRGYQIQFSAGSGRAGVPVRRGAGEEPDNAVPYLSSGADEPVLRGERHAADEPSSGVGVDAGYLRAGSVQPDHGPARYVRVPSGYARGGAFLPPGALLVAIHVERWDPEAEGTPRAGDPEQGLRQDAGAGEGREAAAGAVPHASVARLFGDRGAGIGDAARGPSDGAERAARGGRLEAEADLEDFPVLLEELAEAALPGPAREHA
mmetsp:Transcript_6228/g.15146  ORF Transcript_6228/g.15146 Transcript_6228/m.15146 type:complete len:213 (-) Transcript_6228:564-1202(-)